MRFIPVFSKSPLQTSILYIHMRSSELLCCVTVSVFLLEICSAIDVKAQKERYVPDYTIYHNVSLLQTEITRIVQENHNYMKIDRQYKSRDKLSQLVLHVTNFTGSTKNQITRFTENSRLKILFSYGVHAREFLPTESLLFLLKNLTEGLKYPQGSFGEHFSRYVLSNMDIYIISIANPDGRRFIESTHNYCWRGTKTGVDLDRNFDWEYGKKGSSSNPQDEEYRGHNQFSEPECLAFTDLTEKVKFDLFMSFHSGIKHIYIPYADTESKKFKRRPHNVEDMLDLAMELAHSTKYTFQYGEAYKLNDYTADGTIFDFMAGIRKIPFSFTVELWGQKHTGSSCFDLFNPPSEELQEVLETIHPLYEKLFRYMINWKSAQVRRLSEPNTEEPALAFSYVLVFVAAFFTIIVCVTGKFRFNPRRRIVSLKSLSSSLATSFLKA